MIYIGADHRGFSLKEKIKIFLEELGEKFEDLGAETFDEKDDYTVYAEKVARKIQVEKNSLGILICGSGVGVDITANKFDGVRASIGVSSEQVKAGRKDDDMNVLVIPNDFIKESEIREILKAFLKTSFDNEERHVKRLNDIEEIEKNN